MGDAHDAHLATIAKAHREDGLVSCGADLAGERLCAYRAALREHLQTHGHSAAVRGVARRGGASDMCGGMQMLGLPPAPSAGYHGRRRALGCRRPSPCNAHLLRDAPSGCRTNPR